MTTKFTPGPWFVYEDAEAEFYEIVENPVDLRKKVVADVEFGYKGTKAEIENPANAALIADAPAMYALIKRLSDSVKKSDSYAEYLHELDSIHIEAKALIERHES